MICPYCNQENNDGSNYCNHCGAPMNPNQQSKLDFSSIILLAWIVASFVLSILFQLYTKFVPDWYMAPSKFIYAGLLMISNLLLILPALAIKNRTLKIIAIIISCIHIIYQLVQNVIFAMQ